MTELLARRPAPEAEPGAAAPSAGTARHVALVGGLGVLSAAGAVALLVVALTIGGGRPLPATPGLPDPGPLTGWGLPVVGLLLRVTAVATVGTLLLAAVLGPATGRTGPRALRAASTWAWLWAAATAAGALLSVSAAAGVPVTALSAGSVVGFVTTFAPGRAAAWTVLLAVTVALGARRAGSRSAARALLVTAVVAVVLPVLLAGHAATSDDHLLAVTSIAVHVVAATLWVGGLLAVVVHARAVGPALASTLSRFSTVALGCFVLTGLSGLLSAWVVLGGADTVVAVLGTGYGVLLLAKTAALLVLGALGAWHRGHTLRLVAAGRAGAFRRLAAVEVGVMLATLAVAVGLSASPVPASRVPAPIATPPVPAGAPAPVAGAAPPPAAAAPEVPESSTDMSGHDHGELSVGVLVDSERFHVSSSVAPGQAVTVYNGSGTEVSLTADDGSFDLVVPARTFLTFVAPAQPGPYSFTSRHSDRFRDVLVVE